MLRLDPAAQHRVIQMTMRVNQTRQQNLLAKVEHFPGMMALHVGKSPDPGNLLAFYNDRAILDRLTRHRRHNARSDNHRPV
jgi:hypothetical protein